MSRFFTGPERAVLGIVQANLPDSLTPYADMAKLAGCSEAEVIGLLERLKADGAIRRFGASLRHQKTGWAHNCMVAWRASEEEAEKWGPVAAAHERISHSYFRPSAAPDWPYTLYTMIHGKSADDCKAVIDYLLGVWPLQDHAILPTLRELKKTSMTYFA